MTTLSRRGSPLVTFVLLGAVWVGARAMMWENPFPLPALETPFVSKVAPQSFAHHEAQGTSADFAQNMIDDGRAFLGRAAPAAGADAPFSNGAHVRVPLRGDVIRVSLGRGDDDYAQQRRWAAAPGDYGTQSSMGHTMLWRAAMLQSGRARLQNADFRTAAFARSSQSGSSPTGPATPPDSSKVDRFFLDTWGFYRQGSSSAPISQGRVPTYGASQAGAKLAYRIAPRSGHDPRAFARAYRALTLNGESELALGLSGRPFPKFPVRFAGEVRATQFVDSLRFRPAGYAFTEIAPIALPGRFSLETYAQAGYVGGRDGTFFADGQATATRPLTTFNAGKFGNARLSVGGGVWGGAQKGASRVDIGPTMRVDMSIGKVPARFTVDWRQKVAGDAAPESGVAATVSTRF